MVSWFDVDNVQPQKEENESNQEGDGRCGSLLFKISPITALGERKHHLDFVWDKAAAGVEGASWRGAREDGLVAVRVPGERDELRDERGREVLPARIGVHGDVLDVRDAARAVRELGLEQRRRARDHAPAAALGCDDDETQAGCGGGRVAALQCREARPVLCARQGARRQRCQHGRVSAVVVAAPQRAQHKPVRHPAPRPYRAVQKIGIEKWVLVVFSCFHVVDWC